MTVHKRGPRGGTSTSRQSRMIQRSWKRPISGNVVRQFERRGIRASILIRSLPWGTPGRRRPGRHGGRTADRRAAGVAGYICLTGLLPVIGEPCASQRAASPLPVNRCDHGRLTPGGCGHRTKSRPRSSMDRHPYSCRGYPPYSCWTIAFMASALAGFPSHRARR
jgi:hypothetical protein